MRCVLIAAASLAINSCSYATDKPPAERGMLSANERDDEDLIHLISAANEGDAQAQFELGLRRDKAGDDSAAVIFYRKSANQGYDKAQYFLAKKYQVGLGVEQNYTEAAAWYLKAAEQGNSDARLEIGSMYNDGRGVPQSYEDAVIWWTKASEQGNTQAQNYLALMYVNGTGVPQDYVQAHKWYNLCAANTTKAHLREWAAINRDRLASKMTVDQISEAQRLARAWTAK